ncbi:unnamed protein product [Prunus armeniaca]|uniref:Uncharacterized protein n=1 Tax=Prunus armeniaca TaxID=36596 RepID=A0A6J5UYP3_PRUAR|nr:unnamed protein product [Prunus armeniaca]
MTEVDDFDVFKDRNLDLEIETLVHIKELCYLGINSGLTYLGCAHSTELSDWKEEVYFACSCLR